MTKPKWELQLGVLACINQKQQVGFLIRRRSALVTQIRRKISVNIATQEEENSLGRKIKAREKRQIAQESKSEEKSKESQGEKSGCGDSQQQHACFWITGVR